MALKCAEMATGELASGIADSDVALALSSGGSKFSTLGAGDYMYLRLCNKALTKWEIVKCEGHTVGSDNFTSLTRNVRSSTEAAQAWAAGDLVGQVFPGWAVEELQAALDGKAAADHNHAGTYEPADADILKADVHDVRTKSHPGTTVALTDAATVTPDLTAGDSFTWALGAARNLGDMTVPGVGCWPIVVTEAYAVSIHANWKIDKDGEAADPATGTRVFFVYSLDGTAKRILIKKQEDVA